MQYHQSVYSVFRGENESQTLADEVSAGRIYESHSDLHCFSFRTTQIIAILDLVRFSVVLKSCLEEETVELQQSFSFYCGD